MCIRDMYEDYEYTIFLLTKVRARTSNAPTKHSAFFFSHIIFGKPIIRNIKTTEEHNIISLEVELRIVNTIAFYSSPLKPSHPDL